MNWQKLFEIQAGLDKRIIESKGLQGQDLLDKKILALQVELGELANEARFFKFWSENQEARTYGLKLGKTPRENRYINPLLEEYVDCLHFILSIGNDINIDLEKAKEFILLKTMTDILDQFLWTNYKIVNLYKTYRDEGIKFMSYDYVQALNAIFGVGKMLGFTEQKIEQAYLDKNKINHERQNNGY